MKENWKEIYDPVRCLKKTEFRETWLLARRQGMERCILKKASPEQAHLLQAEAELLKSLTSHPELPVPEYMDFWNEEGFSCLLREYVPGRTLTDLIGQDGPLPPVSASALAEKLCRHVRLFHMQEPPIIHRDIKPDNIVITDTGNIRLVDFETARNYKTDQERDTICMGTRGYAAPEQFGFGQTDERSDIYAIGKVLFYLLTGECEDMDVSSISSKGAAFLKRVILRCCAYDPEQRYQNVDQVISDLEKWQRPAFQLRFRLYALSGLLGLMSLALVVLGVQNHQLRQQLAAAPENQIFDSGTVNAAWNPYLFQKDVSSILEFYEKGENTELARTCEALVEELYENEQIRQVEPVAYWQLTETELTEYGTRRMGYEYIADRLAWNDYLIVHRLGSYEEYGDQIAAAIGTCLNYGWTNEDGSQARSVLFSYTQGDDRNMDGCLIDLLSCIQQALE